MTTTAAQSPAARAPAANAEALQHFSARLAFETDVSDLAADLAAEAPRMLVVDTRSLEGWNQGHIPSAIHLPTSQIAKKAAELIDRDKTVVVYCWGPGCNGAHKAAVEFARLGYAVKEMLGGFEYWAREGWAVETGIGAITRRSADPLTAPVSGISCAC
jgi:rhodanese-related sulfurtransferase